MSTYYLESFHSDPICNLGMFDHKNASGCQLSRVGPWNLTKMIKFYIPSMGMGFDYSNKKIELSKLKQHGITNLKEIWQYEKELGWDCE